jgi:ABC-type antimicrobial peptide transport system permease subunit
MALGAGRAEVLHLMMGSGTKLVVIGLGSGLVVSVGALQLLRHLLFGVNALDPLAFLLVAIFLGSAGLLACYIPARRAASIEPMRALRNG